MLKRVTPVRVEENGIEVRPDGHANMYSIYYRWPKPPGDGVWQLYVGGYGSEKDAQAYLDGFLRGAMPGCEFQIRQRKGLKAEAYR